MATVADAPRPSLAELSGKRPNVLEVGLDYSERIEKIGDALGVNVTPSVDSLPYAGARYLGRILDTAEYQVEAHLADYHEDVYHALTGILERAEGTEKAIAVRLGTESINSPVPGARRRARKLTEGKLQGVAWDLYIEAQQTMLDEIGPVRYEEPKASKEDLLTRIKRRAQATYPGHAARYLPDEGLPPEIVSDELGEPSLQRLATRTLGNELEVRVADLEVASDELLTGTPTRFKFMRLLDLNSPETEVGQRLLELQNFLQGRLELPPYIQTAITHILWTKGRDILPQKFDDERQAVITRTISDLQADIDMFARELTVQARGQMNGSRKTIGKSVLSRGRDQGMEWGDLAHRRVIQGIRMKEQDPNLSNKEVQELLIKQVHSDPNGVIIDKAVLAIKRFFPAPKETPPDPQDRFRYL